jgi:ribosomal protein S18 acetylase RimI-like enzyme
MTDFTIRLLAADDAALFRDIRLEGLRLNPLEFRYTLAEEQVHDLAWFRARLVDATVFGAFRDGELVGVAGFAAQAGEQVAHKGLLWGMYVRGNARGLGVGRALVQRVLDHAQGKVELVQLTVVEDNRAAQNLYAAMGFVTYAVEPDALKREGRLFNEVLMMRKLA